MFPEPVYAQEIVVGVISHVRFAWYVTDKSYWYLDYTKYERALLAAGYQGFTAENSSSRFEIAILNENTIEYFLSKIENRRVPAHALSKMMLDQRQLYDEFDMLNSLEYWNEILNFSPCLLVDFDQKRFLSQYPEMIRFELYVPDGWVGVYKDFLAEISEEERYWMLEGRDLFKRELN